MVRQAAGLTQRDVAEASGMHRTYIGAVERGERNIAIDMMWQFADALHVDVRAFFTPVDVTAGQATTQQPLASGTSPSGGALPE